MCGRMAVRAKVIYQGRLALSFAATVAGTGDVTWHFFAKTPFVAWNPPIGKRQWLGSDFLFFNHCE